MNNLTDEMKIACCKSCLLAERMKDCQNCPFAIGLIYRQLNLAKPIRNEYPSGLKQTALSNLKLSNA